MNLGPMRPPNARALLVLATTLVAGFGTVFRNGFAFDDDILILSNPTIKDGTLFWATLFDSFFAETVNEGNLAFFRPLVKASYFATYQLFGAVPWPYQTANLLLHLLNAWLVHRLARTWLRLRPRGALAAALVFLLHPVQTEPVAWISGRTDLMGVAGILGAVLLAWRWLLVPRPSTLALLLSVDLLGLLSKELAVITPPVLAVLVWHRWPALRRRPGLPRRFAALMILLLALTALFFAVRAVALAGTESPEIWPTHSQHTWRFVIPGTVLLYVRLILWPHPYTLDFNTGNFPVVTSPAELTFLLWCAGCLALAALTAGTLARRHFAGVALALFLLGIGPVSQLRPLVVIGCERYTYFPLIGGAVLAGAMVQRLRLSPRALAAAAVVLLASVSLWNASRIRLWRDNLTLFTYAFEANPADRHKQYVLAKVLLGLGRPGDALAVLHENPTGRFDHPTHLELEGVALINLGRTDEGIARLRECVAMNLSWASPHAHLAAWALHTGDLASAEWHIDRALALSPHDADALLERARLQRRRGETAAARQTLDHLLDLHPGRDEALVERASLLAAGGSMAEARRSFDEVDDLDRLTIALLGEYARLAMTWQRWDAAAAALERITAQRPRSANGLADLGHVRARLGDLAAARALWRRALAADPSQEEAARRLGLVAMK